MPQPQPNTPPKDDNNPSARGLKAPPSDADPPNTRLGCDHPARTWRATGSTTRKLCRDCGTVLDAAPRCPELARKARRRCRLPVAVVLGYPTCAVHQRT
jgi:hypothetical protein